MSKCTELWGSTIECDDGPISYKGVPFPLGHIGDYWSYCAAWDSSPAVLGLMECNNAKSISTKMKSGVCAYHHLCVCMPACECVMNVVGHSDQMSETAGILVLKRLTCTSTSCVVFKVLLA